MSVDWLNDGTHVKVRSYYILIPGLLLILLAEGTLTIFKPVSLVCVSKAVLRQLYSVCICVAGWHGYWCVLLAIPNDAHVNKTSPTR